MKKWLIAGLLLLAAAAWFLWENRGLKTTEYTVCSEELPESFDGFTIVLLSDLHSAVYGPGNSRLLRRVAAEAPDIVAIAGDMVNSSDTDFEGFYSLVRSLTERFQVYYIVGNHEQLLKDKVGFLEGLRGCGAVILDNEAVTLSRDGAEIRLYGSWIRLMYYKDVTSEETKEIEYDAEDIAGDLGAADASAYNILLAHNPVYFETYAAWGADLTLSGHMHGGQIHVPFMGGLFSPEREIFPSYCRGLYQSGGSAMIISGGLGNGRGSFRLFNRPEVVCVRLCSS